MNRHRSTLIRRVLRQGCAFWGLEYLIFTFLPIFYQKSSKLSPKSAILSQNAETWNTRYFCPLIGLFLCCCSVATLVYYSFGDYVLILKLSSWQTVLFLFQYFFLLFTLVLFVYYRQDCRVAANCRYCFYSQAKNQVFAPRGRLVAPIQVKLGRTDGHVGPLGCAKISPQSPQGVGMRPQKYQQIPLFGKESPRRTPLTDFQYV